MNIIYNSNLFITLEDEEQINFYIERYMKILKIYYNIMRLKLNPKKTNILVVCKKRRRNKTEDIRIMDGTKEIKPKNQIRIYGWIMNYRMDITPIATKVISGVNRILNKLKTLKNFLSLLQKKMIASSHLLGSADVGNAIKHGVKQFTKMSIQTCTMKLLWFVINRNTFRESNRQKAMQVNRLGSPATN